MVLADEAAGTAVLPVSVTLEPGSHTLPAITVSQGANLTISGTNTLKSALTNNGTVTVEQNTAVTSYAGSGTLATNQSGKRVKWEDTEKKLVLFDIPYVFEISGIKYEAGEMADMAASIGAAWDAGSQTLTLGRDVSVTGTVGVMQTMTLELNGFRLDWPAASNSKGNPLVTAASGATLTIQDSSAAQTGCLVAEKGNAFKGDGTFVLKSGTFQRDVYKRQPVWRTSPSPRSTSPAPPTTWVRWPDRLRRPPSLT